MSSGYAHIITGITSYTIGVDHAKQDVGVKVELNGWTLEHRLDPPDNTRLQAILTAPTHKDWRLGRQWVYIVYLKKKGSFHMRGGTGIKYIPKDIRKWIRSQYVPLYTKARMFGWKGLDDGPAKLGTAG